MILDAQNHINPQATLASNKPSHIKEGECSSMTLVPWMSTLPLQLKVRPNAMVCLTVVESGPLPLPQPDVHSTHIQIHSQFEKCLNALLREKGRNKMIRKAGKEKGKVGGGGGRKKDTGNEFRKESR